MLGWIRRRSSCVTFEDLQQALLWKGILLKGIFSPPKLSFGRYLLSHGVYTRVFNGTRTDN